MPLDSVTPLQFWLAVLTIVAPQIYNIYKTYQDNKANKPTIDAQAKATLEKAETEAQDRLFVEYDKIIANLRRVEDENRELRPLALKNAIMERDMLSCKEDKEDWKQYAKRLATQLEEAGFVPLPFRRTPADGDTQEKMATVRYPQQNIPPDVLQKVETIKEEK
jgi:hypothetical protein